MRLLIWEAQLQVLFPLIEMERVRLIDSYKEEIESAIQSEYFDYERNKPYPITQYGERLANPYDAELGTIYRMTCLRRADELAQYMLFMANDMDRERLSLLHQMRNSIAHCDCCDDETLEKFWMKFPYEW